MTHQMFARACLTLLCVLQGTATLAIDLNRTHATNPGWIGHARFHVVWQTFSVAILSAVEVGLIWMHLPLHDAGFYLAVALAAVSPAGFLIAWATRRAYDGALFDPNGIPPARFRLFGENISLDLNLAAICAALMSLAVIVAIYRV